MKKLIFILAFLLCAALAEAATIHVDGTTTGGCINGGTNYNPTTEACGGGSSTIYTTPHAAASNLAPDDFVDIHAGTYASVGNNSTINCAAISCDWGTPGHPITWRTYGSDVVTFTGAIGIYGASAHDWTIQDIAINMGLAQQQCYMFAGATFAIGPKRVRIEGGSCTGGTDHGALVSGEEIVFSGVTFQDNGIQVQAAPDHSIYFTRENLNCVVEFCTFINPADYAIQAFNAATSTLSGGIIRYNTIRNIPLNPYFSGGGIMIGADGWQVYSNRLYDFHASANSNTRGIEVQYNSPNANSVYNNTILMNGSAVGIFIGGVTPVTNTIVQNNIVMGGGTRINNSGSGTICTANLTSDSVAVGCATAVDTPANTWTNSDADDFTLKQGSKAIGTGLDLSSIFTLDINGATRTVPWDLGAIKAPMTPTLTLLTPNGGTLGQTGSAQTFTWSFTDVASVPNVRLLYDAANDGAFETTLSASTTNDGSFDFTAPAVTTTGRFRVEDAVDASPFDVSDANVTITAAAGGSITRLISNNTSGTKIGDIGGVTSALLGEDNPNVAHSTTFGIQANKYGAGLHNHSVLKFPTNLIPSTAIVTAAEIGLYLTAFSVTGTPSIDFRNNKRAFAQNEATWLIYSTGNNWGTPGGLNATDRDSAVVCNMPINLTTFQYYTCSSAALTALVQSLVNLSTPNNGLHLEQSGSGIATLTRRFGTEDPFAAYLSITYTTSAPTITLTSPISGAHFFPGKVVPIHWQSQGISGNVRILMSPNAGISYTEIEDSHPFGQVDFVWPVPPMQSSSSVVFKVESVNTPAVFGLSNPIRIGGRRTGLKQ